MFGSEVLEVGIGMALLFLFVSLIATAAQEAVEGLLKSRAGDLERGIRELLNDRAGTGMTKDFYEHPLIYSLFSGEYDPTKLRTRGWLNLWTRAKSSQPATATNQIMPMAARDSLPSYIPKSSFALALLDIVSRTAAPSPPSSTTVPAAAGGQGGAPAAGQAGAPALGVAPNRSIDMASLRGSVQSIPDARIRRVLLSAIDVAGDDLDKMRKELENWYDGTMDRVSGWYKRRSQGFLFFFGLIVALTLNIDAITVASYLFRTRSVRESIVASAEAYINAHPVAPGNKGQGAADVGAETAPSAPPAPVPTPSGSGEQAPAITPTTKAPSSSTNDAVPAEPPVAALPPAPGAPSPSSGSPAASRSTPKSDGPASPAGPSTESNTIQHLANDLESLGYPIGWRPAPQLRECKLVSPEIRTCAVLPWWHILLSIPGWLVTALAVMLGAPFWFDVLNKFMVIRSTVKPAEKSPKDESKDR